MAKFVPIGEAAFKKAVARAERNRHPYAVSARYDRRSRKVTVELNTGIEFRFDPRSAYGLENASEDELPGVRIEGAGGALHFPRLDADFSIARLLEGFLGPLAWTRQLARAEASRQNGKRGGRPKKAAIAAEAYR